MPEKNALILMSAHKCLVPTESVAFQPSVLIRSVVSVVGVLPEVMASHSPDALSKLSVTPRQAALEMPFAIIIDVFVRRLSLARDVNIRVISYFVANTQNVNWTQMAILYVFVPKAMKEKAIVFPVVSTLTNV